MKIIIIDNKGDKVTTLVDLLKAEYPDAEILPKRTEKGQQTFTDWDDVYSYLESIQDTQAILCMDLALKEEDYHDALRGLEAGGVIRAEKKGWVIIAYTQFGRRIEAEEAFRETFDGIIEKGDISRYARPGRVSYVKSAVEAAARKRQYGKPDYVLPADVLVKDSLGMRAFRAAFGEAGLAEIHNNEAKNWKDTVIEALTTGHSGAFMLSIRGTSQGLKSLVLKVAKDEQVVKDEMNAQRRYIDQLGPLTGTLANLDDKEVHIANNKGVYYRQSLVDGQSLLEVLRDPEKTRKQRINVLKPVAALCVEVCASVQPRDCATHSADEVFKLTQIDLGRLETSATFMAALGATLRNQGFWPADCADPETMATDIINLADGWSKQLKRWGEVRTVVQHGDLNPGNVLIRKRGNPVLIDLSRLGHWPIGYDMSRLSLMLRLRLMDAAGYRDWIPDKLETWLSEPIANLDGPFSLNEALCPESVYCDEQFYNYAQSIPSKYRKNTEGAYKLGSLWDMLKVVSYQDVSPYKRLWTLLECWRLGHALGMI